MKNKKGRRRCHGDHNKPGPKPAPAEFVKMMLSEFYTQKQINSINIDCKNEYGMDAEFMNICQRMESTYGMRRSLLPFEIIKFACLYLNIEDIRGITGSLLLPDAAPEYTEPSRTYCSKLEKIRNEVFEAKNKLRPRPEPPVQFLLDYVLEEAIKSHRNYELVHYERDEEKRIVNVIGTIIDSVPKKDDNSRKPVKDPDEFFVLVKPISWPNLTYIITTEVYTKWPKLQPFFDSAIGGKFLIAFKEFLAQRYPNMQEKMLELVNAFTNEYFRWMNSVIYFYDNIIPEIRGNYMPGELPSFISPDGKSKKILIRVFSRLYNGAKKGHHYVFIDDLRFAIEQICKTGVPLIRKDPVKLPRDGPIPLVHRFAEILEPSVVMMILKEISAEVEKVVELVPTVMYSLTLTHGFYLPIVSPFNTHVIPATDAFKRIIMVLIDEVGIGKRIPLAFHPLVTIIKKMDTLFVGSQQFKTLVDRKKVHEIMKESSEMREKFNGKLKKPQGKLGKITSTSTELEKLAAFLDGFKQFKPLMNRHLDLPQKLKLDEHVPDGEPSITEIFKLVYTGEEIDTLDEIVKPISTFPTKKPLATVKTMNIPV